MEINSDIFNYTKWVTLELVKTPSRVRVGNEENECAEKLREIILDIPYFKEHPDNVEMVPLENDPLNRKCVFAFVEGGISSPETVILLSHLDTVGVDDYGELAEYAWDPDKLKEKMKTMDFGEDVQKDLESDDWMFGRGVLDMKSGIAEQVCVLREFSSNYKSLRGNILFISAPDEEAMAKGAQSAAKKVYQMVKEKNLDFTGLIKTDAMLPRYPGDDNRYVYFGTIGKFLLAFYVYGVASHAGECLEGVDSNLITSSIVQKLSMNCDYSDEAEGEITPPPVTLKQTDFKEIYDVQIPYESQVYFNFFTYTKTPSEVLAVGKQVASEVMEEINSEYLKQKTTFNQKAGVPFSPTPLKADIFTFSEFYEKVVKEKPEVSLKLKEFAENYQYDDSDETKLSLAIVRRLFKESNEFHEKKPCIIVYLAPPYVPRVYVKKDTPKDKRLMDAVNKAIASDNITIKNRWFYPYLSDISWFGMSDEAKDIRDLEANTPGFTRTSSTSFEPLTKLKIPGVNIGPYGKDPHQATERLYMPYSFDYVPRLISRVVKNLLG